MGIAVAEFVDPAPASRPGGSSGPIACLRSFRAAIGSPVHLVLALLLVEAALEGLGVLLLLPLLQVLGVAASADLPGWLASAAHMLASPAAVVLAIAGVFVLRGVVAFAAGAWGARLRADLRQRLHTRLLDASLRMSWRFYCSRDAGWFQNLFMQVDPYVGAFHSWSAWVVAALRVAVYLGAAILVAWGFGLAALLLGAAIGLAFRALNARTRELSERAAQQQAALAQASSESIQGYKYIAATASGEPFRRAATRAAAEAASIAARQYTLMAFAQAVREPLAVIAIAAAVLVQVGVLQQPLAPVAVSMLLFYRGVNSVLALQSNWQAVLMQIGAVDVLHAGFAQLEAAAEPRGQGVAIGPLARDIEFDRVSLTHEGRERDALRELSLRLPAGSTLAVVGPSGAGKSTLVDLLTLLLRPRSGRILIDGVDAAGIDADSWRRQIGYVQQETLVFDDSIAHNICLWSGDPATDPALMERLRGAARAAHLDDFVSTLPQGYATRVGARGVRLSAGQRQRLIIARELFRQPRLLILDEATSALDAETALAVRQGIEELHGQVSMLVVTHDLASLRAADQILVLEDGRAVEQGSFDELRARPGSRFAAMLAAQGHDSPGQGGRMSHHALSFAKPTPQ